MPIPRYDREIDETASPRLRRAFLWLFLIAIILGLVVSTLWVATRLWLA